MIKTVMSRTFAEKGIWGKPLAFLGIWDNFFVQSDEELTECKAKLEKRGLSCQKIGNPVTFNKDTENAQTFDKYQIIAGS